MDSTLFISLQQQLDSAFQHTIDIQLLPMRELPASAYYPARRRYRADSLIYYLKRHCPHNANIMGITNQDISTTKHNVTDYGIMGLGFQPGPSCVISSFRLHKNNISIELFKVAIHEWGHNQGLPHCPNEECYMRDAKGGNPLQEEQGFCSTCKGFLKKKGLF